MVTEKTTKMCKNDTKQSEQKRMYTVNRKTTGTVLGTGMRKNQRS